VGKEGPDLSNGYVLQRSDLGLYVLHHRPSQDTTAHPILRALSTEDLSQLQGLAMRA
jgi:hypothetical protein